MPSLYKHANGRWYVAFWTGGVQYRKSLGTTDKRRAREMFADFEQAYHRGRIGLPAKKPDLTLGDLFDDFLLYTAKNRSPRTHYHYEHYVKRVLRPFFGTIPAMDLTKRHIEDFITSLRKRKPKPYQDRTINLRLSCLRAILNRAVDNGDLPSLPVKIKMLRESRPLPKYVTPEQFAAWSAKINKPINRLRAVMELCTGIPDSELGRLTWKRNYLREIGAIMYRRGKTQQEIVVKLNLWAQEAMAELWAMRRGPYLFQGVLDAKRAYEVASRESKVKVTPHMLRHSFATWALSSGEPIANISAILGHGSIATTQIYARVMPTFLTQTTGAIDRMRPTTPPTKTPEKALSGNTMHSSRTKKKPVKG
jgi:integrase